MGNMTGGDFIGNESTQPVRRPKKIGKFRASYLLTVESFELLKKDKEIMWFPVISGILSLIVVALFAVAIIFFVFTSAPDVVSENYVPSAMHDTIGYAIAFVLYIILAFITFFFRAGIVTIVNARINGEDLSFRDGMRNARRFIGPIFVWSVVASTVGIILQFISDRSKTLGKIIVSMLNVGWSAMTFFIVPTLVLERRTVGSAIKESGSIFKRTWGETLIMNFSIGFFFLILTLAVFLVFFVLIGVVGNTVFTVIMTILLALFVVGMTVVSSTLDTIIRVVLYEYAQHDKIPDGFEPELILGAIKKKD